MSEKVFISQFLECLKIVTSEEFYIVDTDILSFSISLILQHLIGLCKFYFERSRHENVA